MKSVAHAWVGLLALERLKDGKGPEKQSYIGKNHKGFFLGGTFSKHYQDQAAKLVEFFDRHKDAFVQGAWFPDSVISDNLTGGHTFKLKTPETDKERKKAELIKNKTPDHLSSSTLVSNLDTRRKGQVVRLRGYTLPDRCEALGHALRDMVLIQQEVPRGSDVLFNDDMISLYFLMLSHYLADAHVPPHSDARDFYDPSKVHPDMEGYWDDEILEFFSFDDKRKVFDYGLGGEPEIKTDKVKTFKKSLLDDVFKALAARKWSPSSKKSLGNNRKIYDYIKAICFVSYLVSTDFIPPMTQAQYDKLKIKTDQRFKDRLRELSVHVLADAIDSIALVWLLTWDSYFKHKRAVKKRAKAIEKEGGTLPT